MKRRQRGKVLKGSQRPNGPIKLAFYSQRILETNCARKQTVEIDIFITSRNCDRKIM